MAQNSKDAQKRTSRAERRAAEAAAMKARAEQMEKERKQQTIIGHRAVEYGLPGTGCACAARQRPSRR